MIIECSRCQTRAKLPDSKEGAKVRCPECGHVYLAQAGGARAGAGRKKEDPTKYFIIGGAILLFATIAIIGSKGGKQTASPVQATVEPQDEGPHVPTSGFNSALVQQVLKLHNLSASSNVAALMPAIDFEAVHAWEASQVAAAPVEEGAEAPAPRPAFSALDAGAQRDYRLDVCNAMSGGRWKDLVADWVPYDGDIYLETSVSATVRVRCQPRDTKLMLGDRWVEWRFAKEKTAERWLAVAWERWVSPDEVKEERKKRARTTTKATLSDGSEVLEGTVSEEFVDWHADTPQELRDEVMQQITLMLDLEAPPRQVTAARERIEEIGKHAVPGLLLKIAQISPDMGAAGSQIAENFQLTYDQAVQIQLCHMCLTVITDWNTSYDVHAAMGTTAERQGSGIRQWFGWYQRKFRIFWRNADKLEDDPFWDDPDFKPRNEKEARDFENYKREREAQGDG